MYWECSLPLPESHQDTNSLARPVVGTMIHKAGAGPKPIPHKKLCIENLRDAIKFAIGAGARDAAARMAEQINSEVCLLCRPTLTR
jgi:hypothetical protein